MRKWFTLAVLGLGLGVILTACTSAPKATPLKIGMVAPVTGPSAESGRWQIQGAKLAVDEINKAGGVLGKQVELVVEDGQTTNPGVILAFSKLAGDKDIPAFIGTVRSTEIKAMSPDVLKIGKPMIIGGTDPTLTHMGNQWYFRVRPHDGYSAKVIAEYGVKTLQKKKWAIIYSSEAFGTGGKDALTDALKALGITPVLTQGYPNSSTDFTSVVLAIKRSGADIMASYMAFDNDLGIFAKQLRQLGVTIPWIGSPSITGTTALRLAGPALNGTYGVADYDPDSCPSAKSYAQKYETAYKLRPDFFSSWSYDGMHVLAMAINNAKSTDPQKIREALMAIKGYQGAEGTFIFDKNGDGLHGYNVVKNTDGKWAFNKHIDFNDQ